MGTDSERPSFIRNFRELLEPARLWARQEDLHSDKAAFGKKLGLTRIGINYEIVAPGCRTSLPHAHEKEEEFVFVVAGEPEVWIDGVLHTLQPGDGVAFPAGTGIAHTILNNTEAPIHLLIVGEKIAGERIHYPADPEMESQPFFWHGAPPKPLGPHSGRPKSRA